MPSGENTRKITREMAVEALLACDGAINPAIRWIEERYGVSVSGSSIRHHRKMARKRGVEIPDPPWTPARGERIAGSLSEKRLIKDAAAAGLIEPDDRPLSGGRINPPDIETRPTPSPGEVRRYILTGAVNNTDIHPAFWGNLRALAEHYGAEILVRRIAYNLNAYRRNADTELREGESGAPEHIYYDPAIAPFICDRRVELAPGLHWAGDAPVTATATSPLSGYDTFTGGASGVFASTKIEMKSIATMRGEPAKLLYTTGVVTQRNYTETKTGQKADWHHSYGAILVEVDGDGDWFPRHLIAGEDGSFCDLRRRVQGEQVREAETVAAITPGDIHVAALDEAVKSTLFGPGGVTDTLRPRELHLHDLHDHESRSHHDARNPFRLFELQQRGRDNVAEEIEKDAAFLRYADRPWMRQVVIGSNHDDHLRRWVAEADWRKDPVNALFHVRCIHEALSAIERKDDDFHLLEWACREKGAPEEVVFLRPDQSWRVCGIECGLHGDKGPNGARGSARSIAKTGAKTNIGHSHSAAIFEGCWQAGVTAGELEAVTMDYASGPSAWSRTMIVTYTNGKRTMITMRGLKWRAEAQQEERAAA